MQLLRDKLYGNLEELRRTAAFMRVIAISDQCTMKKKTHGCHSNHDNDGEGREEGCHTMIIMIMIILLLSLCMAKCPDES